MFPRRTMLMHHLQYNHYPPIHPTNEHLDIAELAIEAQDLDVPVSWVRRMGEEIAVTAREVLDAWHLWGFREESE